jgi:hypothetical protein
MTALGGKKTGHLPMDDDKEMGKVFPQVQERMTRRAVQRPQDKSERDSCQNGNYFISKRSLSRAQIAYVTTVPDPTTENVTSFVSIPSLVVETQLL